MHMALTSDTIRVFRFLKNPPSDLSGTLFCPDYTCVQLVLGQDFLPETPVLPQRVQIQEALVYTLLFKCVSDAVANPAVSSL